MNLPVGNYTFYNNLENCPHKAYHLYVLKDIPRVENAAMKWGNDVHTGMEKRIRDGYPLDETMWTAEPLAAELCGMKRYAEVSTEAWYGITKDGAACSSRDENVWFRQKVDLTVILKPGAWIIDWKTGKPREEPLELQTSALMLKARHPDLTNIEANYYWFQTGKHGVRYHCNNNGATFGKLQQFYDEAHDYHAADHWPKRKNPLCPWCPVSSCEHFTGGNGK